jgi:crotonobetainyl-CoA:carnitine CoA-transferase CaiB-like acyl-CoA transferase
MTPSLLVYQIGTPIECQVGHHAQNEKSSGGNIPMASDSAPLAGLRVLEIGHFVAAPFAGRILADLGAEVIKIEPPVGGDPARRWGSMVGDRSIWWSVHARNKKSVTVDLKSPEGRQIILALAKSSDGIIENFRPGQLEKWGLGPDDIAAVNPDCTIARISGFGQTGPYRDKPAFGVIGEAIGGIRYLTGYPKDEVDLPPVRAGVSLGDSVAGLYAVIGILAGFAARKLGNTSPRQVDVALYEAIFSLLEGALPEFGLLGIVRQPTGSGLPTAAPSNTYRTLDGQWLCIAGNSEPILQRLAHLIGRPDILEDVRFSSNDKRVANAKALDDIITEWTIQHNAKDAEAALEKADVPCCKIYTIADCAHDPHFNDRGMVRVVNDPGLGQALHPGIVPRFAGSHESGIRPGPALGADTDQVLGELMGLNAAQIAGLRDAKVIK